jgi:ABC-type multidrug transport system fused ATPase/permease subunit
VAIARAVLRNPKIYLFDEATSALDTASEQIVQNALNEIAVRKTSISIAHRISTIKDCDMIFVIHNKKVCEQGRFDELLEMKGVFWNINRDV